VAFLHYTGPFSSYALDDDEARESIVHGEHESYFKANPARLLELRTGQLWAVHGPGRLAEAETLGYVADWGQFYRLGCWASSGVVSPAAACHAYLPKTERTLAGQGHLRAWACAPSLAAAAACLLDRACPAIGPEGTAPCDHSALVAPGQPARTAGLGRQGLTRDAGGRAARLGAGAPSSSGSLSHLGKALVAAAGERGPPAGTFAAAAMARSRLSSRLPVPVRPSCLSRSA